MRAKELQKIADKAVTLAKKNTTASITQLSKLVKSDREEVITKLLKEIGPRFANREGGYTRIIKLGFRRGDAAPTALIEYLGADETAKKKAKKAPKAEAKAAEAPVAEAPAEAKAEEANA
jgi:large subunit ribosomal protein L17